eukprot:GHRQ01008529.1.p1 GENE.GHRQ01008529.1~~GHRQ01008529.1.p1  ORF type:complete len:189 (+),score=27.80 GHRQ01008529.1:301-867(+)
MQYPTPISSGMAPLPPIAPGPHSHVTCGGCSTLLMYPQQGASQVRCSRCGHITQAPQIVDSPDQSQIVCNGCRVLLSYPRGERSVQCSLCHTITQVPVYGHVECGGCRIMLMYPLGAQSVKCSVCHFVTNVCPHTAWQPAGSVPGPVQQQPSAAAKSMHTIVVENPPTLDEQGNRVANIAVAVKDSSQ